MKHPKFIQVTADRGEVYALDEKGEVWVFNPDDSRWVVLTEFEPNEEPD